MNFNPLNPWGILDEADARERERRSQIGRLGRLNEDVPKWAAIIIIMAFWFSVIPLPWLLGIYTISKWAFGGTPF